MRLRFLRVYRDRGITKGRRGYEQERIAAWRGTAQKSPLRLRRHVVSAGVGIEPDLVQVQTPGIGQHLRHRLTPVSLTALTNTQQPRVFLTMDKLPEKSTSSSK